MYEEKPDDSVYPHRHCRGLHSAVLKFRLPEMTSKDMFKYLNVSVVVTKVMICIFSLEWCINCFGKEELLIKVYVLCLSAEIPGVNVEHVSTLQTK